MTTTLERSSDLDAWLIRDIPAPVALFDRELRYVAASPAWVEGFALPRAPLAGDRHGELTRAGGAALEEVQRRALAGERVDDCLVVETDWAQPSSGIFLSARPHRDRDGAVVGVLVVLRPAERTDRPDAGGAPAAPRSAVADHEEFARRVRTALADRDGGAILVFAISLDSLRRIGNLHGRAVADQVLKITGERLLSGTRSRIAVADDAAAPRGCDMVARLGDGQFGVICGPPTVPAVAAESLAARLLRLVQSPIALGGRSLRLSASIGSVATTAAHHDTDDVMRDLDIALQRAQTLGPSRTIAWEPSLTRAATRRYTLAEELRRAFDNGEFTLHYQPVLRLADDRMIGAEALLRWNHPSEGLAPSATFIPVLEETGLIVEVGCWVVREAARQLDSWRLLYGREIVDWVSVNLSMRQLEDPSALLATLRGIHDGAFSAHRLKLEIAEPALMRHPTAAAAVLAELAELGIRFAIDDFGTGAASLDGLDPYPIEAVKIDARFVAQVGSPAGEKLLEALLAIGRSHGASIIAEGIETPAQREFLQRSGCDLGQGYMLAEPMDGALFGAYALTHSVAVERPRAAGEPRGRPGAAAVSPPATSAGRSRAG